MKNEIEATFLGVDKDAARIALKNAGFILKIPEYIMRRNTFDFSHATPNKNRWGRVRQEFDRVTMTIKEVTGKGINDTFETELIVNDFDSAVAFFEACNIPVQSLQENFREVWERETVEATIDTWPGLRPFVEVEGPDEPTVRKASSDIGFDFTEAIFGSVALVYEKELGIPATVINQLPEITFDKPPLPETSASAKKNLLSRRESGSR